jgi:aminodeoxyfutalosine synthase
MKLAQVALSYGADDIHGTIVEEHIFKMAGTQAPQAHTEKELIKAIRETGRIPVQRNTFYEPLKIHESDERTSAPTPVPVTADA